MFLSLRAPVIHWDLVLLELCVLVQIVEGIICSQLKRRSKRKPQRLSLCFSVPLHIDLHLGLLSVNFPPWKKSWSCLVHLQLKLSGWVRMPSYNLPLPLSAQTAAKPKSRSINWPAFTTNKTFYYVSYICCSSFASPSSLPCFCDLLFPSRGRYWWISGWALRPFDAQVTGSFLFVRCRFCCGSGSVPSARYSS